MWSLGGPFVLPDLHQPQPAMQSNSCPTQLLTSLTPPSCPHGQGHCLDPATVSLSCNMPPFPPPTSIHTAQTQLSGMQMRETNAQRGTMISTGSYSKGPKPAPASQAWGTRAGSNLGKGHLHNTEAKRAAGPTTPSLNEHLLLAQHPVASFLDSPIQAPG